MVIKITSVDEFEAEYKKGIGKEGELPAHCDASKDNILSFADAIGDNNPLWTNEEYAKKSRFGMIIAPPSFFFRVCSANTTLNVPPSPGAAMPQIENISPLVAGVEIESFRPIWVGDKFTVKTKVYSLLRKQTKSRGPTIFSTAETSYTNQRHELVATIRQTMNMGGRTMGRGGVAIVHDPDKPGVVAKDACVLAFERTRRGAKPRYWEDVEVGEEMEPLEKGVYTVPEMNRYDVNAQYAPRILTGHKGASGGTGVEREAAWRLHDYGQQRTSWLVQLVTDWMGDDGTLKKLSCQVRAQLWIGDISVVKGKVTKKYIEDGEHLVDCDIFVENQGGVVTAPGRATVVLPAKKKG